ncbi:MAG: transglutaminase-like domain-containing protein, partial [Chloroflexota bacterium]|nr:transglutaminase-like domain-containing protein [Chloroflexota bacterium]
ETRTGIPITLSLVFMEVGRRLGLSCSGIGLPGHFIVRLDGTGEYLDPFNGGVPLSLEDCRTLVQKMSGGRLEWADKFLEPLTKHDILFRMLNNLKSIYMEAAALPKAIGVIQRMAIISPGIPSIYQELAWCHAQQHEFRLAIAALETYLKDATDPEDIKRVRGQIEGLQTTLSHLN